MIHIAGGMKTEFSNYFGGLSAKAVKQARRAGVRKTAGHEPKIII